MNAKNCQVQSEPNRNNGDQKISSADGSSRSSRCAPIKRPPQTPIWKLEAQLRCEPCSDKIGRRRRAHILKLTFARLDPEPNKAHSR
jgi:hypothetical protein